jgi:hypothetical protein
MGKPPHVLEPCFLIEIGREAMEDGVGLPDAPLESGNAHGIGAALDHFVSGSHGLFLFSSVSQLQTFVPTCP